MLSRLKFSGASDAIIFNNYIGTNAEGTKGIGSTGIGVDIGNSSSAMVLGGTLAGQGNLISGMTGQTSNTGYGVKVSFSESVLIRGNLIGTDASGFFALGNRSDGIQTSSETSILGNVIAANGEEGITTANRDDQTTTIQGNLIGTDATGEVALPNVGPGIKIGSDSRVIVGGVTEGAGNVISGNGTHGIETSGFSSNDQAHIIQGNQIGTTRSGTPLPNQEHGIQLGNDAGSLVGGADPLAANTIAFNLLHGITFRSNNAVGHTITGNSIFGNGQLGIGMQSFSDTPLKNDPGDADTGPNNRQNYPEISVNGDGSVGVTFNSSPSQPFSIDFYGNGECDDSGFGEGRYYLTSMDVATDANGDAAFDIQLLAAVGQQFISSTATDSTGSTSEFSNCIEIDAVPAPMVIVRSDSLGTGFAPVIKNTSFNVFKVDWADPDGYLTSVGTQTTDDEGRLILDPNEFAPGDAFLLSAKVAETLSKRGGHDVVDGVAFKTVVDNLIVEQDGQLRAVTLKPNLDQPTTTYMGHMTVVFNLVVSIEWPASSDYAVGLVSAFAYASNYLFDVSNGQARFGKIAIYDDKTNWNDADVRMHASNTQWPRAKVWGIDEAEGSLNMPPKHYGGDTEANVNEIYPDVDIDPSNIATALTLGHEFGHYGFGLYDEYKRPNKDGEKGAYVHPFTHFSFMDDQFADHRRSSEMSAFESFSTLENEDFRDTEQYVDSKGRDGWTTFNLLFSTLAAPSIPALVHTPARVRVTHPDVVVGPNDDLDNPDLDVGDMIEWDLNFTLDDTPRPGYLVIDTQTGEPAPGLNVSARRKMPTGTRWLEQGTTVIEGPDRGKIRPFGLKPGDELVAVGQASKRYSFGKIVAPATSSGKLDDEIIIQVSQLEGDQQMLARVEIQADGGVLYKVQSGASLGSQPSVEVIAGDAPTETVALDGGPTEYAVGLPLLLDREPTLVLNAKDTDGTDYPVPQSLSIFDVDTSSTTFSPASAGLVIALDRDASSIQKIAVLSSPFPVPEQGLPDSLMRVSPVYGISVGPSEGQFRATLEVYYNADSLLTRSPTGVTIFKWENGWTALPTGVEHTISQRAIAEIDEPGFYVAYLDLRSATATDIETDEIPGAGEDQGLLQNFPNPFSGLTEIPLVIESPTQVSLVVYNVLGQQVGQLAPRLLQAGAHRIAYDASRLPAGTYIYVIDFEGAKKTGVMLVAR
ncbi:T9SS type A sorting domain-containing protein [Bacteroidota bacterium]